MTRPNREQAIEALSRAQGEEPSTIEARYGEVLDVLLALPVQPSDDPVREAAQEVVEAQARMCVDGHGPYIRAEHALGMAIQRLRAALSADEEAKT